MMTECSSCHAKPGGPPTDYCTSLAHLSDADIAPAIDRAIDGDHDQCGSNPCSDCR